MGNHSLFFLPVHSTILLSWHLFLMLVLGQQFCTPYLRHQILWGLYCILPSSKWARVENQFCLTVVVSDNYILFFFSHLTFFFFFFPSLTVLLSLQIIERNKTVQVTWPICVYMLCSLCFEL